MADERLVLLDELDGELEHLLEVVRGVGDLGGDVAHPVNAVDDAVDVPEGWNEYGKLVEQWKGASVLLALGLRVGVIKAQDGVAAVLAGDSKV